eukprot:14482813-Alexandrium_andersonii.AAC.1
MRATPDVGAQVVALCAPQVWARRMRCAAWCRQPAWVGTAPAPMALSERLEPKCPHALSC